MKTLAFILKNKVTTNTMQDYSGIVGKLKRNFKKIKWQTSLTHNVKHKNKATLKLITQTTKRKRKNSFRMLPLTHRFGVPSDVFFKRMPHHRNSQEICRKHKAPRHEISFFRTKSYLINIVCIRKNYIFNMNVDGSVQVE